MSKYTIGCTIKNFQSSSWNSSELSLVYCRPEKIAANDFHMAILDIRECTDLVQFLEIKSQLQIPVLVLVTQYDIPNVLSSLSPYDDISLINSPETLIRYRLERLHKNKTLSFDNLTGLFNYSAFLHRMQQLIETINGETPLSLMLIDIDNFKAINDIHGHAAGDMILQKLAMLIVSESTHYSNVARFGGEEFALLLPIDEPGVIAEAELLCDAVSRDPLYENISITVSIGMSTIDKPVPYKDLVSCADQALYAAKAKGRNRVVHYTEMERDAIQNDGNVELENFENMTKVVSERMAQLISRRSRRIFNDMKKKAEVDALTRLFNRRYLDQRLDITFENARITSQVFVIALIDIDHFGNVNKEYGWPTGDIILKEVSSTIQNNVRKLDWVARYGGEEICVVLNEITLQPSLQILDRIRSAIAGQTSIGNQGEEVSVTVSIGVAEFRSQNSLSELLQDVSDQLKLAKENGRNCVFPKKQ
ncbi:MAG: GGDEF domain-containing protein [bacterium]|nr:GGDEF domain-containing protein [bacterium]